MGQLHFLWFKKKKKKGTLEITEKGEGLLHSHILHQGCYFLRTLTLRVLVNGGNSGPGGLTQLGLGQGLAAWSVGSPRIVFPTHSLSRGSIYMSDLTAL